MHHKRKFARKEKRGPIIPVLAGAAAVLTAVVILLILSIPKKEPEAVSSPATIPTLPQKNIPQIESTSPASPPATEEPEAEKQILPYFEEMAAENPDFVGWIKIEGTKLDYPLMYTPEDPEKYIRKNFEGNFSVGGLPFIGSNCSLQPRSDNLIIYGHNMANGTMFHCLMNYDQINYWREHPVICLSSLYEEKEYEILAALYDRVYEKSDTCFKFYQFIDPESEEDFNEAITYFKEHALYDTGVTAEYGDKLITLVTCAYHVDNGRFVVVAKEKN